MTPLPPACTYRVQLSSRFTLDDLARQIPYLAELGTSDIYLSPIYTARPGSCHGYDIVDHARIDPELGGEEGWGRLRDALRAHSLGVILDVVPNHMAADPEHNPLWRQVLAEGPTSPAARFFDIDWRPLTGLIRDKVLLPLLAEPYGSALQNRNVALEESPDGYQVRCGSLHLPVAAGTVQDADRPLDEVNADPQRLHAVLERQHYRLAYWRAANDEINYRRFFDVNELIAIHAEDEVVFQRSHELILKLARDADVVRGLRVDHIDGLLDPTSYLQRLRAAVDEARGARTWIVVEKILERTETLDPSWPVDGTTGYDALNVLNRLFIGGRGARTLRHFYERLIDRPTRFGDVAYESKRVVMETALRSGLILLAHRFKRVADASWATRDISLNAVSAALVEFIACLPVYRTYFESGRDLPADHDAVDHALACVIRRNPSMDPTALNFIRSLLLNPAPAEPVLAQARRDAVRRLQQYTSSVQAKGVEDTAYYRDNTLLALNEVGGDPSRASGSVDEFHRFNHFRSRYWPDAHNATSTHDTKLGEDTRIRIATLATVSADWMSAVVAWRRVNASLRKRADETRQIDVNDEYRLYQALVGIWPADDLDNIDGGRAADEAIVTRMVAYMEKAAREAREHTSWIRPNTEYEFAVQRFVRAVLTDDAGEEFRLALRGFVRRVLPLSQAHSISQLILKCLMPGIPDVYQGDESWALCVTDPDNRQPVEFARRTDLKQAIATRVLNFRRNHQVLFARGHYTPIKPRGPLASSAVAFRRSHLGEHVVVAVPRLVDQSAMNVLTPEGRVCWGDTAISLPGGPDSHVEWTNVLSGNSVGIAGERQTIRQLAGDSSWAVLYGRESAT